MIITYVNESSNKTLESASMMSVLNSFAQDVAKGWNLGTVAVVQSNMRNPNGMNVCLVNKFPNQKMTTLAYGYHEMVNGHAIAYARVDAFGKRSLLGKYYPPVKIGPLKFSKPMYLQGVVSVLCHELAEMLIDPNIDGYFQDGQGRKWLQEVCDHTTGNYVIPDPITKAMAVVPDFTLPSFYNVAGVKPYSHCNVPIKPFTLVSGAYGYYKDDKGNIIKL
jgi:hypothetical protein